MPRSQGLSLADLVVITRVLTLNPPLPDILFCLPPLSRKRLSKTERETKFFLKSSIFLPYAQMYCRPYNLRSLMVLSFRIGREKNESRCGPAFT